MDVFNLRTLKWSQLPGINNFRHSSWTNTGLLYSYGGFETSKPDVPIGRLFQKNILDMLESAPVLREQLASLKGLSSEAKEQRLQESILNKYEINPNVVVARIEEQRASNANTALHYYPLNALQKEPEKINSKDLYCGDCVWDIICMFGMFVSWCEFFIEIHFWVFWYEFDIGCRYYVCEKIYK